MIFFIECLFHTSWRRHATHAKGKLVERWKNVSRRLRIIGAIESDKKKPSSTTVDLSLQIFPGNFKVLYNIIHFSN